MKKRAAVWSETGTASIKHHVMKMYGGVEV
jgi:hypothetical protein